MSSKKEQLLFGRQNKRILIGQINERILKPYSSPKIYFGTKRVKGLADRDQPKDITRDWYVHYRYVHPHSGVKHTFKEKGGINYSHTIEERYVQAIALQNLVLKDLEEGIINPFSKDRLSPKAMLFSQAIKYAFSKHLSRSDDDLSHKSKQDYKSAIKAFLGQIEKNGMSHIPIEKVSRFHVTETLEHLQAAYGFANTRYNKIKTIVSQMFGTLAEAGVIIQNPMYGMKGKLNEPSMAHMPYTPEEIKRIFDYLRQRDYRFFVFTQFIYRSGTRKAEILRLRVEDILMDQGLINMEPGKGKRVTKSKKRRYAMIDDEFKVIIEEAGILDYPKDHFMFSENGFLPGTEPIPINRPTKLWKRYVKEEMGIDKTMYALKHTAGDELLKETGDLGLVRQFYGHTSERITEIYTTQEQQVAFEKIKKMRRKGPTSSESPT